MKVFSERLLFYCCCYFVFYLSGVFCDCISQRVFLAEKYLLWMRIDQGYSIGTAGNPPFLIGETSDGSQS